MAQPPSERLFRAAQSGDRRTVADLIAASAPTDWTDPEGMTPLLAAFRAGRPDIARLLIAAGADVRATDRLGRQCMHFAAAAPQCLVPGDTLFEVDGMATNAADSTGARPLHRACSSAVEPLICSGAAHRETRDMKNRTPLMRAAVEGRIAALEALIEHQCDAAAKDQDGRTALRMVAGTRQGTAAVAMLAARSWTPGGDKDGFTPLHAAVAAAGPEGYLQAVILVLGDADTKAVDNRGRTPLHAVNFFRACADGTALAETRELVALLVAHGADGNAKDENGDTPLHVASKSSAPPEILESLVSNGADPCRRNNKGEPAWGQRSAELEARAKEADEARAAAPKYAARPFGGGLRRYVLRPDTTDGDQC